ncbi:flagellar hook-basal body protein [Alicyclobacillus fodiniaquatilis]|jgi:flagellar hook protein FlgE|uniref:Flagellar hook protein FlgE n=1 Tax=Alicyclobacillus fodiniaquatilis TaxID=1661150 RepID=A0ABW4JEK8_9BACL
MLRSMNSAVSGMQAFQTDLDVVGNNIANMNTPGFKASSTEFANILSQTIAGGNGGSSTGLGGTNPQQVGLGVNVAATPMDFSQGPTETTDTPTNVLINGNGLFVVQDASGNKYYTRAGDFSVDDNNNLVLPNGYKALGYEANADGSINTASGPTNVLNLNSLAKAAGVTLAQSPNAQIGSDGSISVTGNDNQSHVIGYLALGTVPNYDGLQQDGDNLFQQTSSSGTVSYSQPGLNNTGALQAGALEQSNVNLSAEFAEMIVAQNGFVANTHMIGTDNQVLQALVSMKNS